MPPLALAADCLRWTAVTYVDAGMFRAFRERYASFWRECVSHPDLPWLSGVEDWGFARQPHAADRLSSLRADLAPRFEAMLAMAYDKGLAPSRHG